MKYLYPYILALFFFIPAVTLACGMAWPPKDAPALMNAERTLIIWDSQKKHQDFIRSVDFETESQSLGFIVPVPSIPDVADAPKGIFDALDNEMERQRPVSLSRSKKVDLDLGGGAAVNVVASYALADFDVQVIEAGSIDPLASWLENNGFFMRPALKDWLSIYVGKKYYFTVFKFRKSDARADFTSKAVRISFATDQPYYPYRDSADMVPSEGRHLLVYFLSDQRYAPDFIQDRLLKKPNGWQSRNCSRKRPSLLDVFSAEEEVVPMFSNKINSIAKLKDIVDFNTLNWLTVWEDKTKKRPNTDIYFVQDNNHNSVLLCDR